MLVLVPPKRAVEILHNSRSPSRDVTAGGEGAKGEVDRGDPALAFGGARPPRLSNADGKKIGQEKGGSKAVQTQGRKKNRSTGRVENGNNGASSAPRKRQSTFTGGKKEGAVKN